MLIDAYGMFHIYPIAAAGTPEGKAAWKELKLFIESCFEVQG